jgi:hypothetical protein
MDSKEYINSWSRWLNNYIPMVMLCSKFRVNPHHLLTAAIHPLHSRSVNCLNDTMIDLQGLSLGMQRHTHQITMTPNAAILFLSTFTIFILHEGSSGFLVWVCAKRSG